MFWDKEIQELHGGTMPEINSMVKCNEMGCKLLFRGQRIGVEEQRKVRAFTFANLAVFRGFLESRFEGRVTKEEYLEWMLNNGASAAMESLSRGLRTSKSKHNSDPDILYEPFWYDIYMVSKRWHEVKLKAFDFFSCHKRLNCQINRKHKAEEYHHTSYASLGTPKEWEDLIPLCKSCHDLIRKCGPRLPKAPSEALICELKKEGLTIG